MWTLYQPFEDPLRVYYGTDTRASGLLIGALLAYIWRPWNAEKSELFPKGKDALLPVGLGALGILIWANMHYRCSCRMQINYFVKVSDNLNRNCGCYSLRSNPELKS